MRTLRDVRLNARCPSCLTLSFMTVFHLRLQHNHRLVNCGRTEDRVLALLCDIMIL